MLLLALVLLNPNSIVVEPKVELGPIQHSMYGSCIEDVNHEIYGGIYGQRVYGESFEEPAAGSMPAGWQVYGGSWVPDGGGVHVSGGDGFKLIAEKPVSGDQEIEADVAIANDFGSNAGFLLRVSNAQVGADRFSGYEVSISPREQKVILGRHENNFRPLADAPAQLACGRWHHVRAKIDGSGIKGARIRVYVDHDSLPKIDFTDPIPLTGQQIGLRTWDSDASFREISVNGTPLPLNWSGPGTSPRWDPLITPGPNSGLQGGTLRLEKSAFNGSYCQSITNTQSGEVTGVANRGLNRWGIAFRKGEKMSGGIALKGNSIPVTVALQSADGFRTYATKKLTPTSKGWTYQHFSLTPKESDKNGRLAIWIDQVGTVAIDQVELMEPDSNLYKHLPVRADVVNKIRESGITFLRYGGTMVNTQNYRWKNMIGPRELRPPYVGHWNPSSTNGFGIVDFLNLCEAANIECAFAINAEEKPGDVADMVDYLTAPKSTRWGQKRAADGHPKPYHFSYIEIGNEECIATQTEANYSHYADRFVELASAIHSRNPAIKLVCAAWWEGGSPFMEKVFHKVDGRAAAWDIHVGADDPNSGLAVEQELSGIQKRFKNWNPNSKMKTVIFEENGGTHSMARALGHATIVNATRRLGNFILVDCAANCLQPVGQNENGWDQGQIFLDASLSWLMPPAVANQLLSAGHQPLRVRASSSDGLDLLATKSLDGKHLILTIVNLKDQPVSSSIDCKDVKPRSAVQKTMSGDLGTVSTPEANRTPIITKRLSVSLKGISITLPPYSISTVTIRL